MKFKNAITIAMLFAATSAMAQVQLSSDTPKFMGVGKMAVTESFAPNLLIEAIKTGNAERIASWDREKTLSLPYDNKRICLISTVGYTPHYNSYQFEEKKLTGFGTNINDGMYPHPSECNRIPLAYLMENQRFEYSPSLMKYASENQYYKEKYSEMRFNANYSHTFIDKLEDNQWTLLMGAIVNGEIDFEVRKKAFNKFKELYVDKGAQLTPEQQKMIQGARDSYKKYPDNRTLSNEMFWAAEDPLTFLFRRTYKDLVDSAKHGSGNNPYMNGLFPKLTVGYFTGQETLDIDAIGKKVYSYPNQEVNGRQKEAYMKMLFSAEILKMVMTLKGLEVNKQDASGNTLWHNTFSSAERNFGIYESNPVAANLTRAMLMMGVNPMLLNKDNKSAYMTLKENIGNPAEYTHILNAFEMDPYIDQ